jgi:hypothetical protein
MFYFYELFFLIKLKIWVKHSFEDKKNKKTDLVVNINDF